MDDVNLLQKYLKFVQLKPPENNEINLNWMIWSNGSISTIYIEIYNSL